MRCDYAWITAIKVLISRQRFLISNIKPFFSTFYLNKRRNFEEPFFFSRSFLIDKYLILKRGTKLLTCPCKNCILKKSRVISPLLAFFYARLSGRRQGRKERRMGLYDQIYVFERSFYKYRLKKNSEIIVFCLYYFRGELRYNRIG